MRTYRQASGILQDSIGKTIGVGYSGQPPHTNNPADEGLDGLGPIPCGIWKMTSLELTTEKHGPDVIVLVPDFVTRIRIIASGRDPDSFRMHGERTKPPAGFASDGCIIMPRQVRMECWNSNDHDLQVIHQQPQLPVNFDWPTPPVDQCGVGAALINLWQAQIEWIGKVGIGPVPNVPKPPTEEE